MGTQRIKSYFETIINKHRDFFQLYTTGLNRKEVERLLKKDTLEALTYYRDKTAHQSTFSWRFGSKNFLHVVVGCRPCSANEHALNHHHPEEQGKE